MTMLKLTYSMPQDEFQTVSVIGDAKGIFDLWFRLSHAAPEYPSHGVANIKIHNLDGFQIDPKKGLNEAICSSTCLSRIHG